MQKLTSEISPGFLSFLYLGKILENDKCNSVHYVFEMVSKIRCYGLNMEVQQSLDGSKLQSGQRLRMDRKYVLGHVSCFVNIII